MPYFIVFTVYRNGWYSSYDDIDMWAYNSPLTGWSLIYSYNGLHHKAKVYVFDSVYYLMDKVKELTGKQMLFRPED